MTLELWIGKKPVRSLPSAWQKLASVFLGVCVCVCVCVRICAVCALAGMGGAGSLVYLTGTFDFLTWRLTRQAALL
jgi:hypothetical protein